MKVIRPGSLSETAAADSQRMNFDSRNEQALKQKAKINTVFIGDSIVRFWDVNLYLRQIGKRLLNRGIEGDTPHFISKRFMADVVQLRPENCFYLAGASELTKLEENIWIADPALPEDAVMERILTGTREVLMLAESNRISMIVSSMLPDRRYQNFILKLNNEMENMCQEFHCLYLDLYEELVDDLGGMKKEYESDSGIPNPLGYLKMTQKLMPLL